MISDEKQPFLSHLEELRKRLIVSAIAVGACFIITYIFSDRLFRILIAPLSAVMPEGDQLIFTNLPEMFLTYLKVAFIAAILLASPILFYQLWMFVAPGLYRNEKKISGPFCPRIHYSFHRRGAFRLFCGLSLWLQVFHRFLKRICKGPAFCKTVLLLFYKTAFCIRSSF